MKRTRKTMLVLMLAGVLGLLVAACGGEDPTATPAPPPVEQPPADEATGFEAEWAALIEEAKLEGEIVTFLCCDLGRKVDAIIPEFEAEFGIKWINSTGSSRQQWDRVQAERAAGKFELDIWTGGLNTSINRLLPGGALTPIKPLLFHPEVIDDSLWFEGPFWADFDLAPGSTENLTKVFAYGGSAEGAPITYNTDLLDPNDIQSFNDLLDPRWDGLRVARDPREAGSSQSTALYYLLMGPDFLRELLEGVVITGDARQAADQLSQGTYAMCPFACGTEVGNAKEQGLPVEDVFPHLLEEGGRISTGGNTLMALDSPPHPAAQKLWVNWWLSKVGQTHYQTLTNEQSLRIDIGTANVDAGNIRQEGSTYLMFERDPGFNDKLNEAVDFAKEVLAGR